MGWYWCPNLLTLNEGESKQFENRLLFFTKSKFLQDFYSLFKRNEIELRRLRLIFLLLSWADYDVTSSNQMRNLDIATY